MRVVHAVEVEDFNSSYGLYSGEVRVASFTDGRGAGYSEWEMRTGRHSPVSRTGTSISTDELI